MVAKNDCSYLITGRYDVRVDASCRVRIPSGWYAAMGKPAHVRLVSDPQERCLDLVAPDVFDEWLSQAKCESGQRELAEEFERESVLLRVGAGRRITLPSHLREHAGIRDTCALLGVARMIKLWNPNALMRETILDSPLLNDILSELEKKS